MPDHNVDEVTMVRRNPDGSPDATPGFKRLLDDDETEVVDAAQLKAIASNVREDEDEPGVQERAGAEPETALSAARQRDSAHGETR